MKTAVIGGNGFIGSHLVKALLEAGREVIVISDFTYLQFENLQGLGIHQQDLEVKKVDLMNYDEALRAIEGTETVYQLAARVGSMEYLHGSQFAELTALQTNLLIDTNVFRACLEKQCETIIYSSSCAAYPMNTQFSSNAIFSESDLELTDLTLDGPLKGYSNVPNINPDGGYGWAKLMGELQLCWIKNIKKGVARIFNVYGENEPLHGRAHVIGDLICKAIRYPEQEFIVYGDGKQTRDFLYASDCALALIKLEATLNDSRSYLNINVGSGISVSIGAIAEKIADISGKNIEIKYDLSKPVGPRSRTANINKVEKLLDWTPKVSLDEGLKFTYAWAKGQVK